MYCVFGRTITFYWVPRICSKSSIHILWIQMFPSNLLFILLDYIHRLSLAIRGRIVDVRTLQCRLLTNVCLSYAKLYFCHLVFFVTVDAGYCRCYFCGFSCHLIFLVMTVVFCVVDVMNYANPVIP